MSLEGWESGAGDERESGGRAERHFRMTILNAFLPRRWETVGAGVLRWGEG